ncbi:26S proteasome non-ATPase regulatory subunit 10-like [Corticium candelabrum]|uniref:26S proteasome non-ATPase regulatory subunit 10-like n=1 Tax=Corticium candelabrum TaxID=121492 RepID=UPI002E26A3CB|nr:26S proteasome non-ATPase regulatory subunit 10-like [Corticium candelabrum]
MDESEQFLGYAKDGDLSKVKVMVEKMKVDVCCTVLHTEGDTALHRAAKYGQMHVCEYLLSRGSPLDVENELGEQPLHKAAEGGNLTVIDLFLKHGAQINAQGRHNFTPLNVAVMYKQTAAVKRLVEAGARVNINDCHSYESPLHHAVDSADASIEIVQTLLNADADVNVQESDYDNTPAHWAAQSGNIQCLELLHSAGAKFDVVNIEGHTVAQAACAASEFETAKRVDTLSVHPLALKDLCRLAIRRYLTSSRMICRLDVPSELLEFLQFIEPVNSH